MSDFYTNMAATATNLLTQFGGSITLKRKTGYGADPVTGVVTAGVSADVVSKGLLKPYPDDLIDGTRIKASDRLLILDASNEPRMTDKPVVQSQEWNIENITSVNPAGTPLVYFVQVRR